MTRFILTAGLVFAVFAAPAQAIPLAGTMTIKFDDLNNGAGTDLLVVDNGPGDANPLLGQIDIFAGVANSFNIAAASAVSDHSTPSLTLASLVVGGSSGMLEVMLSDTGYLAPGQPASLTSEANVTLTEGGSALMQQFVDNTDTLFGMQQVIDHGTFNNNNTNATQSFNDTKSAGVSVNGPFSISEYVKITHTQASVNNTSFGIVSTVTPEPASLALLGLGGLMIVSRKRR